MRRFRDALRNYFQADIYRRLLPYARPYRLPLAIVASIEIAQTGLGLLDPWAMKILIDNGLSGKPLPDWLKHIFLFLGSTNRSAIVVFAVLGGLGLMLAGKALSIAGEYLKNRTHSAMNLGFMADVFNHLQRLSFSFHDRTTVGDLIYRINDTNFISTMISSNFRRLLTSILMLVGILWIFIRLDWLIAMLVVAVAPIQYASIGFFGKLFKTRSLRVKGLESGVQTTIYEVLSSLRVVKAFGQEEREQRRFERKGWAALRARVQLETQWTLFSDALSLVSRLDRSLILLIAAFRVLEGRLTIGELMVILAYVSQIQAPLEGISHALTDMQNSLASAERALEVLDIPDIKDRQGAKTLHRAQGAVAFEDVSFAYRSGHPVLHHVSFTVRSGEVIALVGPTGSGKTTVASLIARFYDPAFGRITLDGDDLRDLTVRALRDNIALVLQEPILFSGTIRDNIAYGRPEACLDEIVAAAKAANADDFISTLPDGYDTQVGERGVQLSGGERQRIAVARAFLKDAPVLILDEPTSSVDSHTEQGILDVLDRLMVGRTTFIIAHRLSTIRSAHQILVMDKGRIIERGTQEELILHNGLYARLHVMQSGALRRYSKTEAPL